MATLIIEFGRFDFWGINNFVLSNITYYEEIQELIYRLDIELSKKFKVLRNFICLNIRGGGSNYKYYYILTVIKVSDIDIFSVSLLYV